jgi:hypothetical protein
VKYLVFQRFRNFHLPFFSLSWPCQEQINNSNTFCDRCNRQTMKENMKPMGHIAQLCHLGPYSKIFPINTFDTTLWSQPNTWVNNFYKLQLALCKETSWPNVSYQF